MSEQAQLEERFLKYVDDIVEDLGHADRRQPAIWYLRGLILPGERKSVEPMAARVCPENVSAAHQSMGHLAAHADWSDARVQGTVARKVSSLLVTEDLPWIIADDTTIMKKGTHSVGVARQYSGRVGKVDNCQCAVSVSIASERGSIPIGYRLYLPEEWANDMERRQRAGVPEEIVFQTKGQIVRDLVEQAIAEGLADIRAAYDARGIALMDAAYGAEADLRDWLTGQQFLYVAAVRESTGVWWAEHQPATPPPQTTGRPRTRLLRDESHQPVAVCEVARALPATKWKTISWREGTNGHLSSRFARVRVRAAQGDKKRDMEWLLIEWSEGQEQPAHFWLSTLPEPTSFKELVRHAKGRWRIERDYEELKSELGLHHYEGRGWRGFHHHATLCIAAYGFLMLERLGSKKKTHLNYKDLPYPDPSDPEARWGPMQRHVPWSIATLRVRLANIIKAALRRERNQTSTGNRLGGRRRRKESTESASVL
jgi:SRSO17 transposase